MAKIIPFHVPRNFSREARRQRSAARGIVVELYPSPHKVKTAEWRILGLSLRLPEPFEGSPRNIHKLS
jgi:hypothetical protein